MTRGGMTRRALLAGALAWSAAPTRADAPAAGLHAFEADSLAGIDAGPRPYLLTLWGLDCTHCIRQLAQLCAWHDRLRIVTIAVDPIEDADTVAAVLADSGLRSEAWIFGRSPAEVLRHAIDPRWSGEKPRSYLVAPDGARLGVSGVVENPRIAAWLAGA